MNLCVKILLLFFLLTLNAYPSAINQYISANWLKLQRSIDDCHAYVDPKIGPSHILYLPFQFHLNHQIRGVQKRCHIQIKFLPKKITYLGEIKTIDISPQGLLYLPKPYVVPGGRFNEMYGWDFIMLGLLQSGHLELAEDILTNYFFEINYYGGILNANRTYHLSRSQPPFLTSAILAIFKAKHPSQRWLRHAYAMAKKEYSMWVRPPFLAGSTGLSRYYDNESGRLIESYAYPNYYAHSVE